METNKEVVEMKCSEYTSGSDATTENKEISPSEHRVKTAARASRNLEKERRTPSAK